MARYSLSNIIKKVYAVQSLITLDEIRLASRSSAAFRELHSKLSHQINHLVTGIEDQLSSQDLSGAALAIRSRRGYQWLKFLADAETLASHLDALQRVTLFLESTQITNSQKFSFSLYHQSALYKIRPQGDQIKLVAQESFLTAPDSILLALIEIALDPSSREPRSLLRDYTFTEEYTRIRTYLEYLGVPPGSFSAGTAHHLVESFHRVNQAYFQGKMPKPHLVWSQRLTQRKFGHYQWDTDTVMVSKSLDQKQIPELVVDYVIYHELLHKKLGTRKNKQNRMAHTREFKAAENNFVNVKKARRLLNRLARKNP